MAKSNILYKAKMKKALACLQQNDLAKAQALCAEVVRINRQDGDAQFMLGIVYARQGQLQLAEQHLHHAVSIAPTLAEAWLYLGQVHELQARYADAEASLARASDLKPGMLDAHEALGRVYTTLGRIDKAIAQFHQVVDQMPAKVTAQIGLAVALHLAGRISEARQAYLLVLSLAPETLKAQLGMGHVCRDMGRLEDALQYYRKASELVPGNNAATLGEADTLERMGRPEQALAQLQPLLPQLDNDPGTLILYAKLCDRLQLDEPVTARLEKALENQKLFYGDRERIEYLLGDTCDRQADYETAFSHYQAANTSVWQRLGESSRDDSIETLITNIAEYDVSSLPMASPDGVTPIFIVGMPRSGTSLVEQIFASHAQVYGAGELNTISMIAEKLKYGSKAFSPTADSMQSAVQEYLEVINERSAGALFVTDKMPQNFLRLGLIRLLFPDAPIIHVRRDALDTCLSCYFQNFSGAHIYSNDLKQLGLYYRSYERLMDVWRTSGLSFMDVQYEDLIHDLETVSRQMIDYCGLDWDDACLRFHENRRVTETASYNQVNKPLYSSSVERWRNYAAFLAPLREGLGD